jgi:hypothetical protein
MLWCVQDYVWSGITMGMGLESTSAEVTALWPGLDSAINSLIPLENVHRAFPLHSSHGDDLPYLPHRSLDPGAGAITTYRAAQTIVKKAIPPGGELFKSYGDDWFVTRPHYFDDGFPLTSSFPKAQAILAKFQAFDFPPLYDVILEIRETWKASSRVLNALPLSKEDLMLALEEDITQIYQKNATRTLEWLRINGSCVDHIVHKPSTIAGAGEGAFAKRRLPKGTIITGTPLITIADESLLNLYTVPEEDDDASASDEHDGRQRHLKHVIYNYCFGHESTSLLLFPYAAVGALFINHGSGRKTNVRVRWAKPGELRHNDSWFKVSPDRLSDRISEPQLGIEYIAIRDIEEGEELLLDYGDKWDKAWKEHVANWRPSELGSIASDWNQGSSPVRTKDEELRNPYPSSINVRCHVDLLKEEEKWTGQWSRYGGHPDEYFDVYGLPCEVLERSPDNSSYKVAIATDKFTFLPVPHSEFNSDCKFVRHKVPRKAIFFLDAPHKSDLYLENAFRFSVQLPDEMVPQAWRNKHYSKQNDHAEL